MEPRAAALPAWQVAFSTRMRGCLRTPPPGRAAAQAALHAIAFARCLPAPPPRGRDARMRPVAGRNGL